MSHPRHIHHALLVRGFYRETDPAPVFRYAVHVNAVVHAIRKSKKQISINRQANALFDRLTKKKGAL